MPNQSPKFRSPSEDRFPPIESLQVDEAQEINVPPTRRTATQTLPQASVPPSPSSPWWARALVNLLTLLIIAVGFLFVGYATYIYRNPYSPLNPLAPATPLPRVITATFLPPTVTVAHTASPILNPTAPAELPTLTPFPVVTPTLLGERVVVIPLTPASPSTSPFAYVASTPAYQPNANGVGCAWLSIAGEVRGLDGTGQRNIGVQFTNQLDNQVTTVFSGSAEAFGVGGYELYLADAPQQLPYQVQLMVNGQSASEAVLAITSQKCEQNVLVLDFVQVQAYP
ncbi:MAG: hypothetical protein ACOYLB_14785 [Phototrophicaceae bacterium]